MSWAMRTELRIRDTSMGGFTTLITEKPAGANNDVRLSIGKQAISIGVEDLPQVIALLEAYALES